MRPFGFTLIELLTTLSIVGILLGVGLPNLASHVQNTRVEIAAQTLLESLELTRSKAVFSNKRITIRKQVNWENGWEVFIDANNNGLRDASDTILQTHEKLKGIRVITNNPVTNYVSYIGTGEGRHANGTSNAGGFQAGTFTVCPQGTGKGYELILARGGRVRTNPIDAQACATI